MGVMACARDGCENILCNRYHSGFGYLCDECFEELVNTGMAGVTNLTLGDFYASVKGSHQPKLDTREYWEQFFQ